MVFKDLYKTIVPSLIRKKIHLYLRAYLRYEIQKKRNKLVVSGPFKGMKIDLDDILLTMLLGTYELEIHPAFAKLSTFQFDRIINVGAAWGYYAVGMALKWPEVTVYAFEGQEDIYRAKIIKLANDNLVSNRVDVRGHCSPGDLINLLNTNKLTLLMLDVEGDEITLLDPLAINDLRKAIILVELHDMVVPKCSRIIEERFQDTHSIAKYVTRPRIFKDFTLYGSHIFNPLIRRLCAIRAMEEWRPIPQEYFLMVPLSLFEE